MLPQSFDEWFECITVKCKENLTPKYAMSRLEKLEDENSQERKKFIECYGEAHLENVTHWFRQIV